MATLNLNPAETKPQTIVAAIRALAAGGSNAVGICTLLHGSGTTVVQSQCCSPTSSVFLFPTTADAAAEVTTTYVDPANVIGGQFTISHANNSKTDRTFYFVTIG
jgi:hypothetical protein